MNKKSRRKIKKPGSRLAVVLIAMAIQVAWFVLVLWRLSQLYVVISSVMRLIALLLVLMLYWKETNAAFKMPWMILIMTFPILGILLYYLMGRPEMGYHLQRRFDAADAELFAEISDGSDAEAALRRIRPGAANQTRYIQNYSCYPLYQNTDVIFYGDTGAALEAQLEALRQAKRFIFLEYHTFEDAIAFGRMKTVLYERAAAGVDVRIIYDDLGCISHVGKNFKQELSAHGVDCRVFNPVIPILSPLINNRDHKKITVVDGIIGFTGGYNLADEYFNLTHPYGQWKDSGVRLEGEAVHSLTVMFLEMWNAFHRTDADYAVFFPKHLPETASAGFVQPYADTPLDQEPLGENIYMNIIKHAERYVWFSTPYLIISDEMTRELALAAKRGIDVRILTPGIPDKKMIFQVTRSYYEKLLDAGVRIFEYTPGFCHAKQCISDDDTCVVGTVNLDYRSLYLHFEDGVFLYGCPAAADIKQDFEKTFAVCREVSPECTSFVIRLWRAVLRLFAPMM